MTQRGPHNRSTLIAVIFLAVFAGLGYRLYDLQVVRHTELLAKVRNLHERKQYLPAVRGAVLDAKMNVLAQTITIWNVGIDPDLARPDARQWAALLAPQLDMTQTEIIQKISKPGRYSLLKKRVPDENVLALQDAVEKINSGLKKPRLRGIVLDREFQRYYPNGFLASHVIGSTVPLPEQYGNQTIAVPSGVDGIEKFFDRELEGTVGYRTIERDRAGRELVSFRRDDVPPKNGCSIVLTLDQTIQHIVEEELDRVCIATTPKSAVAIVLRPETGEILAMASRPTYDLNDTRKDIEKMKNIAIADAHEPGSTFKTVIVSGALDQRVVSLNDTFFCENGKFLYAGQYLHDHKPFGTQSVMQIIGHSVNIGAAKISLKMGPDMVYRYVRSFGFGEMSNIQLPGEAKGTVHPVKDYSALSLTRIAMGHEVTATPLQTAMAVSAIANGGKLMQPFIVKRIVDDSGKTIREFSPMVRRTVISQAASRQMTQAMMGVVSADGTAPKAAVPGWTVAGKTGTAQKLVDGRYENGRYYSSFVGFFPAEKPQLCIFVGLDDIDDYGGQAAAPVFREIGSRSAAYLDLQAPQRKFNNDNVPVPFASFQKDSDS